MSELGRIEELPEVYLGELSQQDLVPLWPFLRGFLPYGIPERKTLPAHWSYQQIRPLLLQAGELAPIEKAERRVLVLCNPGHEPEDALVTPTIYAGMQLILPGETAPNHKHTPSAIRLVIEGEGGYTTVDGQKLPMEPGDLILTPPGLWHEHGHEGDKPITWLDVLDLPLIYRMEASWCEDGAMQNARDEPDNSQTRYRRAGLLPYDVLDRRGTEDYPMLRYPWRDVKLALEDLSRSTTLGTPVRLAYVNPEHGTEALASMGFSAVMLRPGEEIRLPRRTASGLLAVIEGAGNATIDGQTFAWDSHDVMALPTHAKLVLTNASSINPAFLFMVDDAPLHRKLGIYQEFPDQQGP